MRERDGLGQPPGAARADLENLGAQQRVGLDGGLGAIPKPDVVGDLERHQDFGSVEFDARHLTHPIARYLDVGVALQPAGFGEVGAVGFAAGKEWQLVIIQRREHQTGGGGQSDGADDQRVAFGERLHFGVHLPVAWPATFT